jgi:hypothetical protein
MTDHLYAVAISAQKVNSTQLKLMSASIVASSAAEAEGLALRYGRQECPSDDGWCPPAISVVEVNEDQLRLAALGAGLIKDYSPMIGGKGSTS